MGMTTPWQARLHRAAALSLVLAVAPLAMATSASATTTTAAPQSVTAPAVRGFGQWHRESVRFRNARNRTLAAVSCAGRPHAHCVGVGDRTDLRGNDSSYSEVGNGTTWHVVYTAHPHGVSGVEPSGQTGYRLHGVSCTGPNRCIAVGDFFRSPGHERPLAERWNGHSWSVVHTPAPHGSAKLDRISCAAASACMAVGTTTPGDAATDTHLVERWNGSTWSITNPPLPTADTVTIDAVSCATATSCTVAGSATSNGTVAPFADTWSDGVWSTDALPATTGSLLAVGCSSPTACVMVATVGAGTDSASSYSLSGHADTWTQTFLPNGLDIASIACPSATNCVVTGNTIEPDGDHGATATSWDGTTWTPIGFFGRDAFGISCTSRAFCVLVGDNGEEDADAADRYGFLTYVNQVKDIHDFVEAPFPKASFDGSLGGVSCPTSAMCMAVRDDSAIEREHARVWSISRQERGSQMVADVSCVSRSWCMAVGTEFFHKLRDHRSLSAVWNGRGWRTLPPSAAEPPDNELSAVSCSSRTFCLAIDEESRWAQRWNGHSWHPARRPATKGSRTRLTSLSCTSRHFCAAAGNQGTKRPQAVTELWHGSHWRAASVVDPATPRISRSISLSCVNARFCLAVDSAFGQADLAVRWDGRQWTTTRSPIGSGVSGVSCASAKRCIAVTPDAEGGTSPIAASSWNGSSWTPRPVAGRADLEAVSCVALSCTAVGNGIAARIS
jgi:hypothetical protein